MDFLRYMLDPTCHRCGVDIDGPNRPCPDSGLEPPLWQACAPLLTQRDLRWVICSRCTGHGFLRGYPGAYTQEEFDEAFGNDPDDYLEHRRDCEDCAGTGKIRVISEEAQARPEVAAEIEDYWDTENIYRQERAMGA